MEGQMTVVMEKIVMLDRAKAMLDKSQLKRNLRMVSICMCFPIMVLGIIGTIFFWQRDAFIKSAFIIMLFFVACMFFWGIYGYRFPYLYRSKKKMEEIHFPIEYQVEFDESEIRVKGERFRQMLLWKEIEVVCATREYWFFGAYGIPIDKRQVTPEQYQFLSEKYKMIAAKKKRF